MRPLRAMMVGAAIAALAFTLGHAQPVVQNQVTGNECWQVGQGPGGPGAFICLNTVRSTTANLALTVAGSFTVGGTAAQAAVMEGGALIITAQPAVATITMPANPVVDGAIVRICNGTNSAFAANAVTVAANSGQTMVPTGAAVTLTTLAANTCVAYIWNQAGLSWYKVQ
jgi:hypothetical protein